MVAFCFSGIIVSLCLYGNNGFVRDQGPRKKNAQETIISDMSGITKDENQGKGVNRQI